MTDDIPGIALNEDNSHYFHTRAGQDLDAAAVDGWVDQYADTQVRDLMLCPNAMRTSYGSAVWDPIWHGYDPDGPDDQPLFAGLPEDQRAETRAGVHLAWQLHENRIDPYARWIARARQVGISPWISSRMNDLHSVDDPDNYLHSTFWREHPEFRRVPDRNRPETWTDRALDFARPEVRANHMALLRELCERYDFDGLELDWMRFGYHFRVGGEAEGRAILTDWTTDVRALLDEHEAKRGHRIKLGARVPARPVTSWALGMDAVTWARRGLIDMLVVTPFFASIDTDMPIEMWRQSLHGTDVTLAAGLEILVWPCVDDEAAGHNTLNTARGAAASVLDRGADRVYLFNYMDSQTCMADVENYGTLLRELGSLDTLTGKARRHIVTRADTWAPGDPPGLALPADRAADGEVAFRVHIGPSPESQSATIVVGVVDADDTNASALAFRLNGQAIGAAQPVELPEPRPTCPTFGVVAPADVIQPGYNIIELHSSRACRIGWVEISIAS